MNINELNALRKLWASPEVENLNLAWELTISQNVAHLLEAELLVAGWFCDDTVLVTQIGNYFNHIYDDFFLFFSATFVLHPDSEREIINILYSNWKQLSAHNSTLQLPDIANALMRFTGFGAIFVLELNLSEQVDYQLFVQVLKDKMYYQSGKTEYENASFKPVSWSSATPFKLSLPFCEFQFLPAAVYELSEIEHLEVTFPTQPTPIPAALHQLTRLNRLIFVWDDDLDTYPPNAQIPDISNLKNISTWEFYNISHTQLLEDFLSKIPQADTIVLKNCDFVSFSVSNLVRQQLKTLFIDGYERKMLPADIVPLPTLNNLAVCYCPVKQFPANFSQLKTLTVLTLEGLKRLKKFPPFILSCKKINYIWAANNLINAIPEEICRLKCLQTLFFLGNLVEKLPEKFALLPALQRLSLDSNNFKKYPSVLAKLPNLKSISFDDNFLTSFEGILPLPPNLERLTLRRAFNSEATKKEFINHLEQQTDPELKEKIFL